MMPIRYEAAANVRQFFIRVRMRALCAPAAPQTPLHRRPRVYQFSHWIVICRVIKLTSTTLPRPTALTSREPSFGIPSLELLVLIILKGQAAKQLAADATNLGWIQGQLLVLWPCGSGLA